MNNRWGITGNYRCVDDVHNFIVRINLKEVLNENIVENAEKSEVETQNFRWQEKKSNKILYSYVNEDSTVFLQDEFTGTSVDCDDSIPMYLMADFGEYVEDTWIKHEYILCTIKYFPQKNLLSVFPDFTIFEPYRLTVDGDATKIYEYTIENASDVIDTDVFRTEHEILDKVATYRRKSIGNNKFLIPPNDKLHFYVFLEITKGQNFEYDNVYVQYFIDLSKNWSCFDRNCLTGTTQTCQTTRNNPALFFGATFDVALSFDVLNLPKSAFLDTPYVYFEVVSKDTFDRYRTEGVAYVKLPISPGTYQKQLRCLRIVPDKISSNLRRSFIGDYKNYDDVTWFASPKEHNDTILNKHGTTTIETGQIEVRFNVTTQCREFTPDRNKNRRNNSSVLIESVEEVMKAFRRARKNMLEARERAT